MTHETISDPRITAAVAELQTLITTRYPDAAFDVSQGDDPDGTYVIATVDIDDPDDVTDLVISRTLSLQVEEGLPIYVVPVRPVGRVTDERRRRIENGDPVPSSP